MASQGDSRSTTPDADQPEADNEMETEEGQENDEENGVKELPPMPSPIERGVMILRRAKSDTEKFAALLMVTKLIKAEELDEAAKDQLMGAIGLPFLARLLRTNEVPEGCPPFMFKSVALTVLTCFISSCSGNPSLYGLIPVLSEIIAKPELYDGDLTLVKDSYECLKSISLERNGRKAIIDFETVGCLVDAYVQEGYSYEEALHILLLVVQEEGARTWEDEPEAFTKLMDHLTKEFAFDQDERKFKICEYITELLQSLPFMSSDTEQPSWMTYLHKGLSDIILSKLGREQRDKGLRLAGAALESLGVVWVLHTQSEPGKEGKGRQLLLMMVHLACIEVRMSLEDKSFHEAVALASPTTACYTILELAINFLVNGAVDFEQKQKQQLYAALKGAFTAVLTFLKTASADEVFFENHKNHLFVCATIRVLGAWLAEETTANKDEVYETIPFIIKTCWYNFDQNNKRMQAKPKKKSLSKRQSKEIAKEILPDIFRFLLPGLCHLTAEDTPRYILLELELENLLYEYLNYHWKSVKSVFGPQSKGEEPDIPAKKVYSAAEAMETLSNIFMNIVVQEPERVKTDHFYYTLLKFIFTKVPDIPQEDQNLRLSGNLSVLGLMILRHQHPNVKSSDFTIYRFVQTTVRFLWDAHNIEESRDYATLVVSTKYEFHWGSLMDLWFLGMHTLSLLLPEIPWLCDFLIESEWPQTIIVTLLSVREGGMDPGLKSAFEDFLCLLAKSSKPAYARLQEKGVEQVCRNHKMEDLSKVFHLKVTVAAWLENQGLSAEDSERITSEFLQKFREAPAPDYNTDLEGLDKWRIDIWLLVLPEEHHDLLDDIYSLWKSERFSQLSLNPDVTSLLDELSADFNMGLITNGPSVAQWEKINELGCKKYFDSIIVSGDLEIQKPDKDIFYLACEELEVNPTVCIMVGDKIETDILGGINAGVGATIWINASEISPPDSVTPDFTVKNVTEILDILPQLPTILQTES
ncbi:neurochondrin homolog [Palaemon carinicauda]|uniref:neurochondrin homolog n=1 Tax=Palaemon carinicauda TaxID=392227 RepID=UPI0035B59174